MNKNLSLDEVKEIELNLLLAFHSFCKKNNLQYSLCGGSLLGAIRHKGFIPWDDDIDVFMPRPDYERLRELVGSGELIKESYCLVDWKFPIERKGKPFMYFPFLKLIDLNTEIFRDSLANKFYSGIWIDIFPIDGLPESAADVKKIYKKCWFWRQFFFLHYCKKIVSESMIKTIIKIPFFPIARVINGVWFCKILDTISSKHEYDRCSFVGGIINGYGPQEKILKTELEPIDVEFEGHTVCGIKGYDVYLSNLYGDYMQLPPIEKRKTHQFESCLILQRN